MAGLWVIRQVPMKYFLLLSVIDPFWYANYLRLFINRSLGLHALTETNYEAATDERCIDIGCWCATAIPIVATVNIFGRQSRGARKRNAKDTNANNPICTHRRHLPQVLITFPSVRHLGSLATFAFRDAIRFYETQCREH